MNLPAGTACTRYTFDGDLSGWCYTPAPSPSIPGLATWLPLDGALGIYDPTTALVFSRAPLRPDNTLGFLQATRQGSGAVRFGYDRYATNDVFSLPLRMTEAELASFRAFWNTSARGMAAAFVYLDPTGTAQSVRFAEAKLPQIVERAYDAYQVTVKLRRQ